MSLGAARVATGGRGEAVAFAGDVLSLVIDRPYAPGMPIAIDLERPQGSIALRGKVLASRRRLDGRFDVRVRLVNLTREDRARIA